MSILSNIAEGFESKTQSLFIDYLSRAKGSAGELRAQLYLALDREYIHQPDFDKLATQAEICSRQLASFIRYLETRPNARRVIKEDQAAYDI